MNPSEPYRTADLDLACALYTLGFTIIRRNSPASGKKTIYLFERDDKFPSIDSVASDHLEGRLNVNSLFYYQSISKLKSLPLDVDLPVYN